MIEVGSRVKYIKVDTEDDRKLGYYPPIGTLGTVVYVDEFGCQVKWDEGTKGGAWYCDLIDVTEELI
jgi:hypothetical protein